MRTTRNCHLAWAAAKWRPRRGWFLIELAVTVLLVAACGMSAPAAPLVATILPYQMGCVPAPDSGTSITEWDSPVGFGWGMYYNQSAQPVTIESVSLLHPHNLLLHGAAIYKMAHAENPLPLEWGWNTGGVDVTAAEWADRQPVPGAVIPPQSGRLSLSEIQEKRPDLYQIAIDTSVKSKSSSGGWALGEIVKYRQGTDTHTLVFKVGLAIAAANDLHCTKPLASIKAAFKLDGGPK